MRALKYVSVISCAVALLACGKIFEEEELPNTFELAAGTQVSVRADAELSPDSVKVGSEFAGVLAEPLYYTREDIDVQGKILEKRTLVAPEGMPVHGVFVAENNAGEEEARVGLKLTSITFHGGMTFPVVTRPVFSVGPDEIAFELAEPADVALVIDFRKKEGDGNKS